MSNRVGQSWCTQGKHDMLRRLLDVEVRYLHRQVTFTARNPIESAIWYDLMGGDGRLDTEIPGAVTTRRPSRFAYSPGIFVSRAVQVAKFMPIEVNVVDRSPNNIMKLLSRLKVDLPPLGLRPVSSSHRHWIGPNINVYVRRVNSAQLVFNDPIRFGRATSVFIQQDPNTITGLIEPDGLATRTHFWQTSFLVIGVNPGGLKRMRHSTHQNHIGRWSVYQQRVRSLLTHRSAHQDLLIFRLPGPEQWCYVVITSKSAVAASIEAAQRGFAPYGHGLTVVSYDVDPDKFAATMKGLGL